MTNQGPILIFVHTLTPEWLSYFIKPQVTSSCRVLSDPRITIVHVGKGYFTNS